jgi:hypothetical protein
MTEQEPARWGRADQTINSLAASLIVFAAILMIMAGIFQALAGLVAIVDNEFYVQTSNYLFEFDATAWGWIHLIVGVLVGFAGWGLLSGRTWPGWSRSPWPCSAPSPPSCGFPTTRSGRC